VTFGFRQKETEPAAPGWTAEGADTISLGRTRGRWVTTVVNRGEQCARHELRVRHESEDETKRSGLVHVLGRAGERAGWEREKKNNNQFVGNVPSKAYIRVKVCENFVLLYFFVPFPRSTTRCIVTITRTCTITTTTTTSVPLEPRRIRLDQWFS